MNTERSSGVELVVIDTGGCGIDLVEVYRSPFVVLDLDPKKMRAGRALNTLLTPSGRAIELQHDWLKNIAKSGWITRDLRERR